MLSIRQCLALLDSRAVVSLSVVTYDRQRKKGGKVEHYAECILVQPDEVEAENQPFAERAPTKAERLLSGYDRPAAEKRNPQHGEWYTRNIRLIAHGMPTSIIRKIHPALIIECNGQTTTV